MRNSILNELGMPIGEYEITSKNSFSIKIILNLSRLLKENNLEKDFVYGHCEFLSIEIPTKVFQKYEKN